jgi:chaperonin cofactor prefoldin
MLNEDDDDRQFYWHSGEMFFKTKEEARIHIHQKNLKHYEELIQKAEKTIKDCQDKIAETKTEIDILTPKNND